MDLANLLGFDGNGVYKGIGGGDGGNVRWNLSLLSLLANVQDALPGFCHMSLLCDIERCQPA